MKLWMGKDVEGVFEGENTLFIGSNEITTEKIERILEVNKSITQLYFGAGGGTEVNKDVLLECIEKHYEKLITVEVNLEKLYEFTEQEKFKDINYMIIINNPNFSLLKQFNQDFMQIKLQSLETKDRVLLTSPIIAFTEVNVSKLKGKTYEGDIKLE